MLAAQGIVTGETDIVVAGGMESMSNCPYLLPKAREGLRLGNGELVDSMIQTACGTRTTTSTWAAPARSWRRSTGSRAANRTSTPSTATRKRSPPSRRASSGRRSCRCSIPQKKGEAVLFADDESPREDTSLEALGKLKPAFKENGTVTAGNAPGRQRRRGGPRRHLGRDREALSAGSRSPASWRRRWRASSRAS